MLGNRLLVLSLVLLGSVIAWGGGPPAEAQSSAPKVDLAAAAKIYQKSCRACHGNRAQGASSYPRLADKDAKAVAAKLRRYRAGEKFGPNSALMIPQARKLTDQDIANLSVYVTTAFD